MKPVFIALLFLLTLPVQAEEESWYQVEVVVFDRLNPNLDGEQWMPRDYEPRKNLVELLPRDEAQVDGKPVPFSLMPPAKNRLSGIERVFRLSSEYRPLMHFSWQQLATERREAEFVKIQKLAGGSGVPAATRSETESGAEPAFIEDMVEPDRIVDGAIRIRSGFYLHVDVDLTYFTKVPQENRIMQTAAAGESIDPFKKLPIQLKETRKIKLNEIHYFDHPMFGLLIQVSRLES